MQVYQFSGRKAIYSIIKSFVLFLLILLFSPVLYALSTVPK